jgi:hypothetical protein
MMEQQVDDYLIKLLTEAIDEALSVLGKPAKTMIYFHLNSNLQISKQEIPYRLNDFIDELEKILGHGAKQLELQLIRVFQAKADKIYPLSREAETLQACMLFIKQKMEKA